MHLKIEILNWNKFNPQRKDQKSFSWFRMEHRIYFDPEWLDFSAEELSVWFFLLSFCSFKNTSHIEMSMILLAKCARVQIAQAESAIEKLKQLQCIKLKKSVTGPLRTRNESVTLRTDVRTVRNGTNVTLAHSPKSEVCESDLENCYQSYPRKVGKSRGLKIARVDIKTKTDLESLTVAIRKFSEHHRALRTEPKFVPYFATFMGQWRDWLADDAGTSTVTKLASIYELCPEDFQNAGA